MRRPTHSWESTSNTAMMEQSCLPSQSYYYRSCSKNIQRRSVSARKARTPSHPYGPAPAHNATTIKEQSPLIPVETYLRSLGLLMYLLIKSRPNIMTAVSFGATNKSTYPTQDGHYQLYYIVEYLRVLADKGHSIYIPMVPSQTEVPNRL